MRRIEHRPGNGLISSVAGMFSVACIIVVLYFVLFHGTPMMPH